MGFWGSRAIKRKFIAWLSPGSLAEYAGEMCGCKILCQWLEHLACLTAALCVLQQSCILIRSQELCKENEHIEKSVFVVVAAVQP